MYQVMNGYVVDTPGFSHLKFDFLLPYDIKNLFVDDIQKTNREKLK